MNIFVLDHDIRKCARYHADQHVIKMILESTQLLCTVINLHGGKAPYKSTHIKHPCVYWAGESAQNWRWLQRLALALNDEYRYRYRKNTDHGSAIVARKLDPLDLPDTGLTEFAQAMPDAYKVPGDPVAAYRKFYIAEKSRFAKWTRRKPPSWYIEGIGNSNKY
ncbi:MAG: pyrimidine dimer DNA glycosylase/endonuclease V [Candidatus Sumerlaeia bacterium]